MIPKILTKRALPKILLEGRSGKPLPRVDTMAVVAHSSPEKKAINASPTR